MNTHIPTLTVLVLCGLGSALILSVICWNAIEKARPGLLRPKLITLAVIASVLVLIWLSLPSAAQREQQWQMLFRSDPTDIQSVSLSPVPPNEPSFKLNLTNRTITVKDPTTIARVCRALATARPFQPNHPGCLWTGVLEMHHRDREQPLRMVIISTGVGSQNGVLLEVKYGWLLQYYRCDHLDPIVREVVANANN